MLRCARLLYSRIARDEVYLLYPALFNPSLKEQEKESVADCIRKITNRVPDREAAALELHRIAVQYVDRDRIVPIDAEGFTTLWIREKSTGELRLVKMPAMRGISTQFARFAEEAYRIAPELARVKTLHYTACFEQITGELDPDRDFDLDSTEISQIANSLSLEELEDVLQESLQRDCTGAGIVSATLLGNLGTAESVVYLKEGATRRGARILPRILVQATQSKNRRIRFAATEAVMKLNPMKAYPGSSLVSDSLSWFAKGEGRKTAIIASPHIDDAMKLSGSLIALGYTTKIATTNTEAMREALASPDVRLVIVDWNCTRPIIPEFAQKMRSDSRTHEIPIAVIARDEQVLKTTPITKPLPLSSKFERSVSSTMFADSIAMILPYPQDDSQTAFVVGELLRMSGVEEVPDERRLEQSKKALRWLAGITRGLPRLYRIENLEALATDSAYSPALHREGIELAAQMQSNRMQVLLVNIATTPNLPASFRDTAGNAFAQSVQKHGILIRGQQIGLLVKTLSRQYEEERPDPVLESIVRTIEQKNTNR